MKNSFPNEKELVSQKVLSVPTVESYELKRTTEKGFTSHVELEDGYHFDLNIYVLKNAFPMKVLELVRSIQKEMSREYLIIVAPFVSEATRDICEKEKIGFIDYAGNCLIQYYSLYISVTGNKNTNVSKRTLKSIFEKSSTVSSLILRIMFEDIYKSWRLKALSEYAQCSIGQVSKVKEFLLNNVWIEMAKEGMKITNAEAIMKAWAKAYGNKKDTFYECYSLDGIPGIENKLKRMKEECSINYYLTGFSGGVRYTPVVRYSKIHVYIAPEDVKEAMLYLECKRVDTGANLTIIEPYDDCVLKNNRIIEESQVVSPVQIYLDCMQLKGRGEEIAEAILAKEMQ